MSNIICPNCNESFHETTDAYDPSLSPHGGMFRLKKQFSDDGWDTFTSDDGSVGDNLFCPGCGGLYIEAETGRVRVDELDHEQAPIQEPTRRGRPKKNDNR